MRSGDIIAGSFAHYREYWAQPYGKLFVVTAHPPPVKAPVQLVIKAVRLDTAGVAHVYTSETKEYRRLDPLGADTNLGWNGQIILPSRGEWLLVASMHESWGCWAFRL